MQLTTAQSAGFCFGVNRAMDRLNEIIETHSSPIYTFGPLIHNEEVIRELSQKGVIVIDNEEELLSLQNGVLIIRSHGIGKQLFQKISMLPIKVIDMTCPFVKKIHEYVEEYTERNYHILVVGDPNHPEVLGIVGWGKNGYIDVIRDQNDVENFQGRIDERYCIVAQTTYNALKFKELVEKMRKKGYDIIVLNTICNATSTRQAEAKELAANNEAMIVIGGKASSNTQKLFEICKMECENTYYIQTIDDLDLDQIRSYHSVGITAGASTPNKIIEEVQKNVRNEF